VTAEITSTQQIAICAMTSDLRTAPNAGDGRSGSLLRTRAGVSCLFAMIGAAPQQITTHAEIAALRSIPFRSATNVMRSASGANSNTGTTSVVHTATSTPAAAPATAISVASINVALASVVRVAPIAILNAVSRDCREARESSSTATFAQAIRNTAPDTAGINRRSRFIAACMSGASPEYSATTNGVPPSDARFSARCASRIETPSRRRPMSDSIGLVTRGGDAESESTQMSIGRPMYAPSTLAGATPVTAWTVSSIVICTSRARRPPNSRAANEFPATIPPPCRNPKNGAAAGETHATDATTERSAIRTGFRVSSSAMTVWKRFVSRETMATSWCDRRPSPSARWASTVTAMPGASGRSIGRVSSPFMNPSTTELPPIPSATDATRASAKAGRRTNPAIA
jgi:hypothetical protein